jgi:hypothetical protein
LAAGAGALLAAASQAAPPEDGKAAFERRADKRNIWAARFMSALAAS